MDEFHDLPEERRGVSSRYGLRLLEPGEFREYLPGLLARYEEVCGGELYGYTPASWVRLQADVMLILDEAGRFLGFVSFEDHGGFGVPHADAREVPAQARALVGRRIFEYAAGLHPEWLRIEARIPIGLLGVARLVEDIGMYRVGRIPHGCWYKDGPVDTLLYAISTEELLT